MLWPLNERPLEIPAGNIWDNTLGVLKFGIIKLIYTFDNTISILKICGIGGSFTRWFSIASGIKGKKYFYLYIIEHPFACTLY